MSTNKKESSNTVSPKLQNNEKNQNSEDLLHNGELGEILGSLPEEKRKTIVTAIMQSSFRGPLPPPEILKGYENILPNAAARILKMAEDQMNHRQKMEYMIVDRQTKQGHLGQILGFVLVLVFGVVTFVLGCLGHDILAGTIGTTTILGLAVVFVLNKKPSSSNKDIHNSNSEKNN